MLEGIHILNQTEITKTPNWCYIVFIVIAIVISLGVLLYGIIKEHDFVGGLLLGLICGLFFGAIILAALCIIVPEVPTGEYTYQVTIEKSVVFKEFDTKYYVIKQEGEIYTIGEK